MRLIDEDGNEVELIPVFSFGGSVENGVVKQWHHDHRTGERAEWEESLCDSPLREVFPAWIWDLTQDPRNLEG